MLRTRTKFLGAGVRGRLPVGVKMYSEYFRDDVALWGLPGGRKA